MTNKKQQYQKLKYRCPKCDSLFSCATKCPDCGIRTVGLNSHVQAPLRGILNDVFNYGGGV